MAFLKHSLTLCVLVHCLLSLLHGVHCDVDLDELFKGFNIYRNSLNQSLLSENSKAKCIAEEIAKHSYIQLPCSNASNGNTISPANNSQLPQFPQYSMKCHVGIDNVVDGVILPVYVPKLMEKLMLTDCTHSQAAKYLGNAEYTKVGLATHEDCLVIALGTDTNGGSYSAGVSLVPNIGWAYWLGVLFVGSFLCLETKDMLFKGMNSYRSSMKLPIATKNSKAECLAQSIAWDFDDQSPFSLSASGSAINPSNFTQLPNLPDYLSDCKIDRNHTKGGMILPLNIPKLALNLVLSGCTHFQMAKYLSKPEYTSVGIGHYENWVVFVLGTNSSAGSFSSSATLSALCHHHMFLASSLLLGLFLISG